MSETAYPTLGFDPAPGEPERVEAMASTLHSIGVELSSAQEELRAVGRSDDVWQGRTAEVFVERVGGLLVYLDRGLSSIEQAMRVLMSWQHELEEFQARARMYEQAAADAAEQVARDRAELDQVREMMEFREERADEIIEEAREEGYGVVFRILHPEQREQDLAASMQELESIRAQARALFEEYVERAREVARVVREAIGDGPSRVAFLWEVSDTPDTVDEVAAVVSEAVDTVSSWVVDHSPLLAVSHRALADTSDVLGVLSLTPALHEARFFPPGFGRETWLPRDEAMRFADHPGLGADQFAIDLVRALPVGSEVGASTLSATLLPVSTETDVGPGGSATTAHVAEVSQLSLEEVPLAPPHRDESAARTAEGAVGTGTDVREHVDGAARAMAGSA